MGGIIVAVIILAIIAMKISSRYKEKLYYKISYNTGIPYRKVKKEFKKFNKRISILKKAGVPREEIRMIHENFYRRYGL